MVKQKLPRRGARSVAAQLALAAASGMAPACLNPDISDEAPWSVAVAALDGADAGAELDEAEEDDAAEDAEDADGAEDSSSSAPAPPARESGGRAARRRSGDGR